MTTHIESVHRAPRLGDDAAVRSILERKIAEGTAQAGKVIESVFADVPTDQIVRASAVKFAPSETGIVLHVGDQDLVPSHHALGQVAERAGVPADYLRVLVAGEQPKAGQKVVEAVEEPAAADWRRQLAADILDRHYGHGNGTRVLARSVRGQLRGWLSDKYRRLDSRPLLEALTEEAQKFGAIPVGGTATETRTALKVILPDLVEPIPGEFLVLGGEWSNSDYGNGTHGFRSFLFRVWCLNGAVGEDLIRQIHLGGKLSDNIAFSDKTYQLDTETSVSALRDVVSHALGPAGRDSLIESIQAAHGREFSTKQLAAVVKNETKTTQKLITDAFDSEDVINLPAGKTAWRASNAISWVARHSKNDETKLDLERLAGSLVPTAKEDKKAA